MIGAMLALSALTALMGLGVSPLLALPLSIGLAMLGCMVLGYGIERIAYRPLRHAPRLAPLITAIGVSIVLQNLAMMIWGREYHAFPQLIANHPHTFGGAIINDIQIIIFILALAIMAGLMVVVHRTRLGRAMRAVAENQHAAQLMGVDINRVIPITFMLGSALAAVAGVMVSANYGLAHYYMGFLLGLKAFTAAVLGGIGHLRGAMLGGLLLVLIESLGAGYIGDLTGGFLEIIRIHIEQAQFTSDVLADASRIAAVALRHRCTVRTRLGAHRRFRDALHHAGTRAEHRGRLCGIA